MPVAFPGESAEYRAARNRLVDREIELRRAMEAVAEARRRLRARPAPATTATTSPRPPTAPSSRC